MLDTIISSNITPHILPYLHGGVSGPGSLHRLGSHLPQ